jgi:hypothetical protein
MTTISTLIGIHALIFISFRKKADSKYTKPIDTALVCHKNVMTKMLKKMTYINIQCVTSLRLVHIQLTLEHNIHLSIYFCLLNDSCNSILSGIIGEIFNFKQYDFKD